MDDAEAIYHRKVRAWIIEHLGNEKHHHLDPQYFRNRKSEMLPWSECFDMRETKVPLWDFDFDWAQAYQYSEYTGDSAHADLYVKFPITCSEHHLGDGVTRLAIADGEDLSVGKFAFTNILRQLLSGE